MNELRAVVFVLVKKITIAREHANQTERLDLRATNTFLLGFLGI
jgi:hypothetical protein